jgi:hypothetical protein
MDVMGMSYLRTAQEGTKAQTRTCVLHKVMYNNQYHLTKTDPTMCFGLDGADQLENGDLARGRLAPGKVRPTPAATIAPGVKEELGWPYGLAVFHFDIGGFLFRLTP